MTGVDHEALLQRIGLDALPAPDAAGLTALHRAFLTRVPYENVEIQLGRVGRLDLEAVAARVLDGGRGGYCFELNGLLAALLDRAGFTVALHTATVGPLDDPGPVNHLALVVTLDGGRRFLADAGFGEGFLTPVPLVPGRHPQGPLHWTVQARPDGGWWLGQHRWGSTPGFRIDPEPVGYDAFDEHHTRLSRSPESPFVRTLVVQRPHRDRITTLRSIVLTEIGPHVDSTEVLQDRGDLARTLERRFGIRLPVDDITVLWSAAEAQYDAHLRLRRP